MLKNLTCAVLGVVVLSGIAYSDAIYLKDGKIIRGTITEEGASSIYIESDSEWKRVKKEDVERIVRDNKDGLSDNTGVSEKNGKEPKEKLNNWDREKKVSTPKNDTDSKKNFADADFPRGSFQINNFILKAGMDLSGKHKVSLDNYVSGYGNSSYSGTEDVENGLTLTAEYVRNIDESIGWGAGLTYQIPRKQTNYKGDFCFLPIYGLFKLGFPVSSTGKLSLVGHLGINGFAGDSVYKGVGGELTGGQYWGIGGEFIIDSFQFGVLYMSNQGSMNQTGYYYDYYYGVSRYYEIKAKVEYTTLNINVGVKF